MTHPIYVIQGVSSIRLPEYLDQIIDKKVHQVALSYIERFVHWFLTTFSCFYPAYKKSYDFCSAPFAGHIPPLRLWQERAERLHQLPDGVGLFDYTDRKIASCSTDPVDHYDRNMVSRIELNGKLVLFNPVEYQPTNSFGKSNDTRYVSVKNIPNDPKKVIIYEHKLNGTTNHWVVDTSKEFIQNHMDIYPFNSIPLNEPRKRPFIVYVTEDAILRIEDESYLKPKPTGWFTG